MRNSSVELLFPVSLISLFHCIFLSC